MPKHFIVFQFFALVAVSLSLFAQIDPKERESLVTARETFKDGLYGLAKDEAVLFIEKFPESKDIQEIKFILASSYLYEENIQQAIDLFRHISKTYPESRFAEESMRQLVIAYELAGQIQKAFDTNELFLVKFPNTKYKNEIRLKKLKLLFLLQKYRLVINNYNLFDKINILPEIDSPQRVDYDFYLAVSIAETGEKEKAIAILKKMLRKDIGEERKVFLDIELVKIENKGKNPEVTLGILEKLKDYYESESSLNLIRAESAKLVYSYEVGDQTADNLRNIAEENLKPLLEKPNSHTSEALFIAGWFRYKDKDYQKAEEYFTRLETDYPVYAKEKKVALYLSEIYEATGNQTLASIYLEKGLNEESDENNTNKILLKQAQLFLDKKQPDKALEKLDQVNFEEPEVKDPRYNFLKASAFFSKEEYDIAADYYEKIQPEAEEFPHIFNEYLISLAKSERTDELYQFMDEHFDLIPEDKREQALNIKHDTYFSSGNCDRVIAEKDSILENRKNLENAPGFYVFLGDCYLAKNKSQSFVRAYWKAFKLYSSEENEEKLAVANKLSAYYQKKGDYRSLADVYRLSIPFIKNKEQRNRSILFLGKVWQEKLKKDKNNLEYAEHWYLKLHGKGKANENFEASSLLGEIYINSNQIDKALKVLTKASGSLPRSSPWFEVINHRIAQIYQSQEKWNKSLKYYTKVLGKKKKSALRTDASKQIKSINQYLKSQKN